MCRVKDCYQQEWVGEMENNPKLNLYRNVKNVLDQELYITTFRYKKHISVLARLRSSSHDLATETGRHANVTHDERYCKLCSLHFNVEVLEDELHFVLTCPFIKN